MLIALITFFVLGSSAGNFIYLNEMKPAIEEHVTDETRVTQINSQIDSLIEELKKAQEGNDEIWQKLTETNKSYDWTVEDMQKHLDEIDQSRHANFKSVLDFRFKLKESLSKKEWKDIVASESKTTK